MIPFLFDEAFNGMEEILPPFLFFADVLPAWYFVDDEKADAVTFGSEIFAIGVMAGPDDIDPEFLFEDSRIFDLRAFR